MYKIPESLLIEVKNNINKLLEELWLTSELTPEEFKKLPVVKAANNTIELLKDNYGV
jgi:hypothetical protein